MDSGTQDSWMRWIIKACKTNNDWATKPVKQSAVAIPHSKILLGLCKDGVFAIAIMTARFPRKAKMQQGTLTIQRIMSFMRRLVSLLWNWGITGLLQMILALSLLAIGLWWKVKDWCLSNGVMSNECNTGITKYCSQLSMILSVVYIKRL